MAPPPKCEVLPYIVVTIYKRSHNLFCSNITGKPEALEKPEARVTKSALMVAYRATQSPVLQNARNRFNKEVTKTALMVAYRATQSPVLQNARNRFNKEVRNVVRTTKVSIIMYTYSKVYLTYGSQINGLQGACAVEGNCMVQKHCMWLVIVIGHAY